MNKLLFSLLAMSLFSLVYSDQASFDQFITTNCRYWESEVNNGPSCCCFEKPGDLITCAQAKTNWLNNQATCGWTGILTDYSKVNQTGNCAQNSNLYKQVYSDVIQCFSDAKANSDSPQESPYAKSNDIDTLWILLAGFLVFFMQTGFAALEVGSCPSSGAKNILLKNMTDNCAGALVWWLCGYALAYGPDLFDMGIIGGKHGYFFAGKEFGNTENAYRDCFFQLAFATTSATIVSGAIAGRTHFWAYFVFSCFTTAFIYPTLVHWTWGQGWLYDQNFIDFAGSGCVHITGGTCGLMGAIAAGPRLGRFLKDKKQEFNYSPHNVPLVVIGTLILWFGWFGFNAGSTISMSGDAPATASLVAVNTMLAGSAGGLMTFLLRSNFSRQNPFYDVCAMCNGILAGLVSVTAPCGNISNGSAILIGLIGGAVYHFTSLAVQHAKVDDPLDAFAVHGGGGIWGVISLGFFDKTYGLFYGHGINQVWVQFYGTICQLLFAAFFSALYFFTLRATGYLRISTEEEKVGIDQYECGGKAYYIGQVQKELAKIEKKIVPDVHLDNQQEIPNEHEEGNAGIKVQ